MTADAQPLSRAAAILNPRFAAVLEERREELNIRFALARRQDPALDPERFGRFLVTGVNAVAAAVDAIAPHRLDEVVLAAYDVALALSGGGLLTAAAGDRLDLLDAGWTQLLPAAAARVAEAPRQTMVAVSNALYHLTVNAGARPRQWLTDFCRLTDRCTDVAQWLAVGQICAWRAGLAHFRETALALADRLPPSLALAAVGADAVAADSPKAGAGRPVSPDAEAASASEWDAVRANLQEDPWFIPGQDNSLPRFWSVGSFEGFGGVFRSPPVVSLSGRHLLARSGAQTWLVAADAFGATFHRASADELQAAVSSVGARVHLPSSMTLAGQQLNLGAHELRLPVSGPITSVAADAHAVAITSAFTHAIIVVTVAAAATSA